MICPHCGHRGSAGKLGAFFTAAGSHPVVLARRVKKQQHPTGYVTLVGCPECRKVFISMEEEA